MKAIFFDKDGTLVDETGVPRTIPKDKALIKATVEGMRAIQQHYLQFIVSNQAWVATGTMTLDEAHQIFENVTETYLKHGVKITGYAFCSHGTKARCLCRKPRTGLLEQLTAWYHIEKEDSWFVGNLESDVLTGKNFGIKTCIVENGKTYCGKERPDIILADVNTFAEYLRTRGAL